MRVTEGVRDIVWDGVSVDVGDAVFVELLLAVAVMVVREVELPVEIAV